MRFTRQLVIHADDVHETAVEDGMVLEKPAERIAHFGLTLAEAAPDAPAATPAGSASGHMSRHTLVR
jgi:hypothetical protein